ncbi:DUF1573 domain-containing protein, partial [bacterium]|nr:DUF1573 domain-containing protein [bacterium]
LYIDNEFDIWASTEMGVSRYNYAEWEVYGATEAPLNCLVSCVADDCQGGKWFGTSNGLARYLLDRWTHFAGLGLGSNMINDMAIDGAGKLWAATDNGVSVFADNVWNAYNRSTGGPSHDIVTRVTVDMDDNKWFATTGGGVSVFLENHQPDLSAHLVSPKSGVPADPKAPGTGTEFEYSVYMFDPDVEVASLDYFVNAHVYIDGIPHQMALADGAAYNGTYSFSIGDLPVGQHTYYFYFEKASGNVLKLPASGVFSGPVVDDTAPDSAAFLDGTTDPYTQSSQFSLHFSAEDLESGVRSVALYVRNPGGEWEGTGLTSFKSYGVFTYTASSSGNYEFCSIATNNSDLVEEFPSEADCMVVLDWNGPGSYITTPGYKAFTSPALRLPFTAWDDESGVDFVELWYMLDEDDSTYNLWPHTLNQDGGLFIYTALKEGWHTFYTIAVDKAGNRQTWHYPVQLSYDNTAPESSCSTVEFAGTNFDVPFTFDDPGSGVGEVDLYYRLNGGPYYHAGHRNTGAENRFPFTAAQDGVYEFYTIAADFAGNVELPPSVPDATCISDITAPVCTATCKEAVNAMSIDVSFVAHDVTAGVEKVTLWFRYETSEWMRTPYTVPFREGEVSYPLTQGEGQYYFAVVATDYSGNEDAAIGDGDCSTYYDIQAPSSMSWCEHITMEPPLIVTYSASDVGSGLNNVYLYYKYNDELWKQSDYGFMGTPHGGEFFFMPLEGGGRYEFYTVAEDTAGNREDYPPFSDCESLFDLEPPVSSVQGPAVASSLPIMLLYEASDDASGIVSVELWYSFEMGEYSKYRVAWGSVGGVIGFTAPEGPGNYRFYTIATDNVGRSEAASIDPDLSMLYAPGQPSASLLQDEHDFGEVLVDESSNWVLKISNAGASAITVEDVRSSSQAFTASWDGPTTIQPGDMLPIDITFTPHQAGLFEGTIGVELSEYGSADLCANVVGKGTDELSPKIKLSSTGIFVSKDDRLVLSARLNNPGEARVVDAYIALRLPGEEALHFYPNWMMEPTPMRVALDENGEMGPVPLLDVVLDDSMQSGEYTLYGALVVTDTEFDVIGEINILTIIVE